MRKIVCQKLDETKLFTKIWIDDNDMVGSAYETAAREINQSKAVFVLLSDHYCASDFCRREWKYAVQREIQVYVIVVQKNFDKKKYDWVGFLTVDEIYFKLHQDADMAKLIRDLGERLGTKNSGQVQTTVSSSSTTTATKRAPKGNSEIPAGNGDFSQKTSINKWKVEDVQNWCSAHHLERWREPLKYFDGKDLVKLRRDLSNDQRIQLINHEHKLDIFEITRFKSELDKITTSSKKKPRPVTARIPRKPRLSKTDSEK